jgi:excisionase family DNA binding protein
MTGRELLPGNVIAISGSVAALIIALPGFDDLRVSALGTNAYPQLKALYLLGLAHSVPPNGTLDTTRAPARPDWLTTKQASEVLGLGERAVVKRLAQHQLRGRKEAGRWRVDRQHVEEQIRGRRS